MRPTIKYLEQKFDYINQLCFNGELVRPVIGLNSRRIGLGCTKTNIKHDDDGNEIGRSATIEISVRFDFPEEEYIDTLVHEMIHYYIFVNKLTDDGVHGTLFMAKAQEITSKYGIKVTVIYDPPEDILIDTRDRPRIVCVARSSKDGQSFYAVVVRNKVFELWEAFERAQELTDVRWYISDRAIFKDAPVAMAPQLFEIDSEKIQRYLTGARQLVKNGNVIEPV